MTINLEQQLKKKGACCNSGQLISREKGNTRTKQKQSFISPILKSELESAFNYLRTNHTNPDCTISACASVLSITERRIEQIFHETLQITPKYCLRIKTALWLKQHHPEFRIKDIYQKSGFNTQSTFAREFKAILQPKRNTRSVHHIKFLLERPNSLKVVCYCSRSEKCDQWIYSNHSQASESLSL